MANIWGLVSIVGGFSAPTSPADSLLRYDDATSMAILTCPRCFLEIDSDRDLKFCPRCGLADVLKAEGKAPSDAKEMRGHFQDVAKQLGEKYKLTFATIGF